MAIKQLQLRGISRTPSDRATADGGCAESLNVHLDQTETAPTLPPEDISDTIYGSDTNKYPIIYIHKMTGITNYIGRTATSFYAYGDSVTTAAMGGTVPSTETVQYVTSVGNTLIIFTENSPYYYLFKNGAYTYLGNSIPRPQIEVVSKTAATDAWQDRNVTIAEGVLRTAQYNSYPDISRWKDALVMGDECYAELQETISNVWGAIQLGMQTQRNEGNFVAPFFIRYALRLYDGSYIASSAPILCGAGKIKNWVNSGTGNDPIERDWASVYLRDNYSPGTDWTGYKMCVRLNNIFKVHIKGDYTAGNWSDIVKSIDFFASEPIYTPAIEAKFSDISAERKAQEDGYLGFGITFETMENSARDDTIRNAVLAKGQFYKIMSIELNDTVAMGRLSAGTMTISNSEDVSGDNLFTHETFPDSFRDAVQYIPLAGAQNFNGRLLLLGAEEELPAGDMFLNGQMAGASNSVSATKYQFRFKIVNPINGMVNYVMARYRDGGTELKPAFFSGTTQKFGNETGTASVTCVPYSWISYPDTRCTEVEVAYWTGNGRFTYRIPMEKHPLLECAYAFFGLSQPIQSGVASGRQNITNPDDSENRSMKNGNKLLLSEFENPFLFPAENIITFKDDIIGAATVSVPLSEGQFGEYPLYCFTEGGIRVLVTTAEGTFAAANAHPNLSRHIALPGTIYGLEQTVVFTTDKGVMLLSGNQVTEISGSMNGRPDILHPSVGGAEAGILVGSDWADLLDTANNTETLMAFMSNAMPAYDNKGSRILFFNPDRPYQYEYRLNTQTWHKTLTGITQPRVLNAFPDCLLAYTPTATGATPKVVNCSTTLTDATILSDTENPVYGIIATRPFDLGEPDVRKSINDIRIRGKYNRQDVMYILLGSFDGLHWQRLTSLRGGSYKMFRMVLLTRLTAMERITWIDIDYESRFTNRLR